MIQKVTLTLVLLSCPVWATTFAPMPFSQAVQEAPVIVRGIVGGSHFESRATLYDLQVTEIIKGSVDASSLTIRQPGGRGLRMSGAASLEPGEDVVIFLNEKNAQGSYDIHGLSMGKLTVGAAGVLSGPALDLDRNITNRQGGPARAEWTLSDLRELIQPKKESGERAAQAARQETPESRPSVDVRDLPVALASAAVRASAAEPTASPQAFRNPASQIPPSSPKSEMPWKSLILFAVVLIFGMRIFLKRA